MPESKLLGGEPRSGYHELIGYELSEWREDLAELRLSVRPEHLNRAGVVHGGVLATLIDTACGFSASYCPYEGRVRRGMTLSLTVSFTGQASGGQIRAVARKRGGGSRIVACTAEVFDGAGRLIAVGEATFRYRTGSERPEGVPL